MWGIADRFVAIDYVVMVRFRWKSTTHFATTISALLYLALNARRCIWDTRDTCTPYEDGNLMDQCGSLWLPPADRSETHSRPVDAELEQALAEHNLGYIAKTVALQGSCQRD